jgi:hypothetical protein
MVDDPRPGPETSGWLLRRAPRFTRLWAAKAVSHLGDGAALVALVVYVQQTQGRGPGAVSALLLATTLPTLVGPPAGALVDRVEQRRLMLGAQAGQALLYGAMATVLPPFPVLLVLVAAASLLATVFAPAGRSVVPSLVSPGELVRANSWMGMALTFQGTIGPAVGGVLVAGAGVRGALWGNALSFGSRPRWWLACPSLPQEADGQRVGLLKGNVGRARLRTRPPGRPGAGHRAGVCVMAQRYGADTPVMGPDPVDHQPGSRHSYQVTSASGRVHVHAALPDRPTDPGMTPRSGRFRVRPARQNQPHHQGPPPSSLAVHRPSADRYARPG